MTDKDYSNDWKETGLDRFATVEQRVPVSCADWDVHDRNDFINWLVKDKDVYKKAVTDNYMRELRDEFEKELWKVSLKNRVKTPIPTMRNSNAGDKIFLSAVAIGIVFLFAVCLFFYVTGL